VRSVIDAMDARFLTDHLATAGALAATLGLVNTYQALADYFQRLLEYEFVLNQHWRTTDPKGRFTRSRRALARYHEIRDGR
jgi:hypothetical protein